MSHLSRGAARLHFPEQAFPLHLFLEHAERLIDIVVPDEYLQNDILPVAAARPHCPY